MSMYAPDVSSTSSQARGPRPLSRTCVRPFVRGSKPSKESLQSLVGLFLDVVEDRVAMRVDADDQRAEGLDAELADLGFVGDREGDFVKGHLVRLPVALVDAWGASTKPGKDAGSVRARKP